MPTGKITKINKGVQDDFDTQYHDMEKQLFIPQKVLVALYKNAFRMRTKYNPIEMFQAHLEYIYHIICSKCKAYFTYATMNKNECIDSGVWYCPRCGAKGSVKIEDQI